jgi:hypothetical protein
MEPGIVMGTVGKCRWSNAEDWVESTVKRESGASHRRVLPDCSADKTGCILLLKIVRIGV